jgi:hypothetical protein
VDPVDAASGHLALARKHLAKVQAAWLEPADWADLAMYGLYALENAVVAVAEHVGVAWEKSHWNKVEVARKLHSQHGLPDIADLLTDLNDLRKSEAYGEPASHPEMSAEDIALVIETYVEKAEEAVA